MDRTERFYKIKELLRRRVRIIGLAQRNVTRHFERGATALAARTYWTQPKR